jgi:hypothetical protein
VFKYTTVEHLKTLGFQTHDCGELENISFSNTRLSEKQTDFKHTTDENYHCREFERLESFQTHDCQEIENLKRLQRHKLQPNWEPKVFRHTTIDNLKTLGVQIHDCRAFENTWFSNTRLWWIGKHIVFKHPTVEHLKTLGFQIHDCGELESRPLCTGTLYRDSVQGLCTGTLYRDSVQGPCTRTLYMDSVQGPCTGTLYMDSVGGPCTGTLHRDSVQGPCTGTQYRDSVQGPCNCKNTRQTFLNIAKHCSSIAQTLLKHCPFFWIISNNQSILLFIAYSLKKE